MARQDENGLRQLFEKTESFKGRVVTSTVKIIRSELEVLNTGVKAFGRFDPAANPKGLDFQEVLGNTKKHGLGADIPDSGLRQDMLNDSILLKDIDILCAAGDQHDEIQCQISRFFIARAIREVYPAAVDYVFGLKRTEMELDNSPG
jgi:hypothetical protein